MSTITLPNIRVSSDLTVKLKLKDGGVAIDWSTLQNIKVSIYSDAQRALAGRCGASIDAEDPTLLVCTYAANKPQYVGVNRVVVSAKYMGETKTYDKPAFNFVRWTDDQAGEQITIDDPDIDVEISVEDVSSSILQEAVDAAFTAADRANDAAEAAEHMVDIHTGPEGKSAYEVAVEEGYTGTEEEWLASLKGPVGETPDISIGTVTTVEPGTPAAASMSGTPEAPVLNLSIPKGLVGATPNFTVGTVTTGEPGSSVIVTITGTPEAPVLNLTIPQGMQGNTGSSVDYPYELVNNLTTNDATKGLSAAQGVVLDGKVSQLEAKINDLFQDQNGDTLYITDPYGNIIAKIDADGIHTTEVEAGDLKMSDLKAAKDISTLYDKDLYITDADGNVVFQLNKDGILATSIRARDVMKNPWGGKILATYGDSITASTGGDFDYPYEQQLVGKWGNIVGKYFDFAKHHGRGIGSTSALWLASGGQVAWCDTDTGVYVGRNDSYTYDNYTGTIPDGCTKVRGCGSSWLRITTMFPASIKDTIDTVLVMFHNDYHQDMDTDVVWVNGSTTDPEWAASDEYEVLGGDYNIADSVKAGFASIVMKLQAWMPQARIVLMTPISGVYASSGAVDGDFDNAQAALMLKLAKCVKDVAERMSIPCIDNYGNDGINSLNRTAFIADKIHPNNDGNLRLAQSVIGGLSHIIPNLSY